MTLKEFAILADAIKTYYPKDNMLPTKESMALWYDALKDLDYRSANLGLKKYVMSNKFPPAISDIRECALDFERPKELSEMEAWSLVSRAMKNGYYGSEKEFKKFPAIVQKVVGSPSQIHKWAMDESFNEAVVSSNFMRVYREELQKEKEMQKLPTDLKNMIASITNLENRSIEKCEEKEEKEEKEEICSPFPEKFNEMRERIRRKIKEGNSL